MRAARTLHLPSHLSLSLSPRLDNLQITATKSRPRVELSLSFSLSLRARNERDRDKKLDPGSINTRGCCCCRRSLPSKGKPPPPQQHGRVRAERDTWRERERELSRGMNLVAGGARRGCCSLFLAFSRKLVAGERERKRGGKNCTRVERERVFFCLARRAEAAAAFVRGLVVAVVCACVCVCGKSWRLH